MTNNIRTMLAEKTRRFLGLGKLSELGSSLRYP